MKSGILGEMNEAYRVDVLKQYPFRVWPGENFVPEQVVLDQMALDGWYLHWYDRTICIGGYLQDGLTKGSGLLEVDNPMGYAMLANHKLKYLHGLEGVRAAIQHIALSVVGRNPSYILESNRPWLTALMLPIGLVWSIRRHKQFGNRVKKARSIT